jgi:polyphosphate kinase
LSRIEREIEHAKAGRHARIRFKLNSLVDEEFCDYLYWASEAGVDIDLWVRGICSLQPGVMGRSDRIRVRSILGRFLEHSRIFHFHNDGQDEYYIGSADLMERNLDRRVEALARVDRDEHKQELDQQFNTAFSDEVARWELTGGTSWRRVFLDNEGNRLIDVQESEIARRKDRRW